MKKTLPSPRILALLILSTVYVAAAGLQAKAAISKCAAFDDPTLLLECYEQLTKEWLTKRKQRDNRKKTQTDNKKSSFILIKSYMDSGWQLAAEVLTDDGWERLNLRLYSTHFWVRSGDEQDIVHLKDLRPSLWFQCIGGKMSGFIDWGVYLDIEKARVVFRFDNEPAQAAMAQVSKDRKKIEPLSEKRVISRIKEMFGKKKLTARVTPLGEKPIAVTFNISRLETAIKPLRKSCNW